MENTLQLRDQSDVGMEVTAAPPAGADQAVEKAKKRYRKKKTKLEEAFPSYLQVTHTHTHSLVVSQFRFCILYSEYSKGGYIMTLTGRHKNPSHVTD